MRSQLVVTLGVALTLAASEAQALELGVTLHEQRAELVSNAAGETLHLTMRVKNHLPVPIASVRVGALIAAAPEPIDRVEAARAYQRGGAPEVRVIDERVRVALEPGAHAPITIVSAFDESWPEPRAFRTHVLGYGLARLDASVLLDLLQTPAPADELAAVEALALSGTEIERAGARARFGADAELVSGFVQEALAPVPERPTEAVTFRRVYAVRALGVLGTERARAALTKLLADEQLDRFDEPLQVLRIARLAGSPLETPLAYAVPASVQRMRQLVEVALADIDGLAAIAVGETPAHGDTTEPSVQRANVSALEAGDAPAQHRRWLAPLAAGLSAGLALVTWALWRMRRRQRETS